MSDLHNCDYCKKAPDCDYTYDLREGQKSCALFEIIALEVEM